MTKELFPKIERGKDMETGNIKEFRLLEKLIKKNFETEDIEKIKQALDLAEIQHKGQERKYENAPYIVHPARVANILIEELKIKNVDSVVAGLLHDVVEDCDYSLEKIGEEFGQNTQKLVDYLSHRKSESDNEYLDRIFNSGNSGVKILKMSDRLDNLRSLKYASEEFKIRYLKESQKDFLPRAKGVNEYLYSEIKKEINRYL